MILMLLLVDLIFFTIFNFPIYILLLIFLFYKNTKLIIPIVISVIMDILMAKICLSFIVVILSLMATKLNKKTNFVRSLIFLLLIYFGIHFYLGQLNHLFFVKLILVIGIYLLVLKLPMKQYKLTR